MTQGMTPSEQFVASLCERSFLKLWTHPNPKGKNGKELCDCLVVCGPHIAIISVKENAYRDTGDRTGWERWTRVAIDKSADQIWGAQRWLESVEQVTRKDGRVITLPPHGTRKYHRVAVALGANGQVPLKWGKLGTGFIHVCDEKTLLATFSALDTITDFVNFLKASEKLANRSDLLFMGGIEDLVALYILSDGSFDNVQTQGGKGLITIGDDLWRELLKSDEFKKQQEDFEESRAWDNLIEHYAEDLLTDGIFDMFSKSVSTNEMALVTMALQPRENRAVLARALLELLKQPELKLAARAVQGANGCAFVLATGSSADREARSKELALRCFVVRGRIPGIHTVVGISTDRPGTSTIGYSSDIVYLHKPEWSDEDEKAAQGIQNDLGYFKRLQRN